MKTRVLPSLLLLLLLPACDPPGVAEDAGYETGPCIEGACFSGLECLSDLCVGDDEGTDGDPSGSSPNPGNDGGGDDGGGDGGGGDDGGGDDGGGDDGGGDDGGGDGDDGGGDDGGSDDGSTSGGDTTTSGGDDGGGDDGGGDDGGGDDGGGDDGGGDDGGGGVCPEEADALGICEQDIELATQGSPEQIGIRDGLGATPTWDPTQGSAFVVVGSGPVSNLELADECSEDVPGSLDPGMALPAPVQVDAVEGDCITTPALIGTGDCSGTLEPTFGSAFDYAAVRLDGTVPAGVQSFSYDHAFLTTEYPEYVGTGFNDMHVAWLESEAWTGNTAFDADGNPVSANTTFLDVLDDDELLPELGGTCMQGHGASRWHRTTAPVVPGESFTLVLATFDVADSVFDSYAFVDNFTWSAEALESPTTALLD